MSEHSQDALLDDVNPERCAHQTVGKSRISSMGTCSKVQPEEAAPD